MLIANYLRLKKIQKAAAADICVCLHRPARTLHAEELCAILYDQRGGEYVHLLHGDSDADYANLLAVRLSGGIYHGDRGTENACCDGNAVHSADVDKLSAAHTGDGGIIQYVFDSAGRRSVALRYVLRFSAVYDLPDIQHAAKDGPVAD